MPEDDFRAHPDQRKDPRDLFAEDAAPAIDYSNIPADGALRQVADAALQLAMREREIEELSARLDVLVAERTQLSMKTIPALLDSVGTDRVGVPSMDCDVVVEDFCRASVKVDDPPEFREAAFSHLEELGGGDLIRATLVVSFAKEDLDVGRRLLKGCMMWLKRNNPTNTSASLALAVHHGALTSFVKQWMQDHAETPLPGSNEPVLIPERLGATIGRICRVIPRSSPAKRTRKKRR